MLVEPAAAVRCEEVLLGQHLGIVEAPKDAVVEPAERMVAEDVAAAATIAVVAAVPLPLLLVAAAAYFPEKRRRWRLLRPFFAG